MCKFQLVRQFNPTIKKPKQQTKQLPLQKNPRKQTNKKIPTPTTSQRNLISIYFHVLVDYIKFIFFIVNLAVAYSFMNKFCYFCSENTYDVHIINFSTDNTLRFWDYLFVEHAVPYWLSPFLCSRFSESNILNYRHFLIIEGGKCAQMIIVFIPMDTPFQWIPLFSILLYFKHPGFPHFVNITLG